MKRILSLTAVALLGLTASAWAKGLLCLNCGIHCIEPPPPPCLGCGDRCDNAHHHCCKWKSEHVQKLIDELCHAECCCDRISAAKKLGHRCHADICCCPDVLHALVGALQDDCCWEVRQAAAWSIAMQGARNRYAVLALYLASKADPHYMVRDRAADGLDILLVCRRSCCEYKELFEAADALIVEVRARKLYKPGTSRFSVSFDELTGGSGIAFTETFTQPLATAQPTPVPELIPPPKPNQ
jgi:hypothetical protein